VDSIVPSQNVIFFHSNTAVTRVFKTLVTKNIYSAPIIDSKDNSYLGFIDLLDIVAYIVDIADKQKEKRGSHQDSAPDLYELLEQVEQFDMEHASRITGFATQSRPPPLQSGATIQAAISVFKDSGAHRLPIMQNGTIKAVLTQSTLISWLYKNLASIPDSLKQKTVSEFGFLKPVISVHFEAQAIEAFRLMAVHKIHGIAVVDDDGKMFSNLSAKDIKLLAPDAVFTKLYRHTRELVSITRASKAKAVFPSFCVSQHSKFEETVAKMDVLKIHRLYIEDEHCKPIGVVSLGDILKILS